MMGTRGKINAIWWNIKINLQKLVYICGYELPTKMQNFAQKDLTEVKIFQKVLGSYFFETPCSFSKTISLYITDVREWHSCSHSLPFPWLRSHSHSQPWEILDYSPILIYSRKVILILSHSHSHWNKKSFRKQVRQQDAYLAIRPAYPRWCCPRAAKGDKTYLQPVFLHW